jgi:hypothetical protein
MKRPQILKPDRSAEKLATNFLSCGTLDLVLPIHKTVKLNGSANIYKIII